MNEDAYSPPEIAARVEEVGVAKARLPLLSTVALGVLGGAFIGLGSLYYTLVTANLAMSDSTTRVLGGVAFSLGLILVVLAGAELFTGNNLLVMAWVSRRITLGELLRNWTLVFAANAAGAVSLAAMVVLSGQPATMGGAVAEKALHIAVAKVSLPFVEAFFRGVLCNVLVCLAVWLAMAGRSVTDRILAVVFPVSAFVALGFEHSVANLYFIPLGLMLRDSAGVDPGEVAGLTWAAFARSLVPVTAGNIVGGGVLVALVYWAVYGRRATREAA